MLKNHVFFSIKGKRWSDRHVTKKIVQQKKPAVEHLRKPHTIMSISIFFLHVHTCPFFLSCPFFRRVFDWFWILTTRPTIWRWRKTHKTYLNFLWKTEVQEKRTHINLVFFSVVSSCMDIIWCKKNQRKPINTHFEKYYKFKQKHSKYSNSYLQSHTNPLLIFIPGKRDEKNTTT